MSHKDIAKVALGLILSLAITFFVIVIGVMLVQAGYYFGGYWLSIPVGLAYAYGVSLRLWDIAPCDLLDRSNRLMKQHYILSVLLFPVLAALIFVLAPIIALVMVFLMDHGIMKAYYVMWRKVRRYKNETKKLVERQVRRLVYSQESSV